MLVERERVLSWRAVAAGVCWWKRDTGGGGSDGGGGGEVQERSSGGVSCRCRMWRGCGYDMLLLEKVVG